MFLFCWQMDGPYAHGSKTAAFLVRMSLERWAARNLRADNTSVIVAYFDPPGTTSADLTRESSTLSNASTLLTSDPVGNLGLHDADHVAFGVNFGVDVDLDPSFYDADEAVHLYPSVHQKHGCERKRKHVTKGNGGTEENGIIRPWSLTKSNCLLHKKRCSLPCSRGKLNSCLLKNKHRVSDGSSSAAPHDTELEFKVLIGHPDKFVSASTTGVESEQIDTHLKRDKQLSSDSAHPNIIQHKCIAAQPSGEAVAGCGSVSVRQVASNITNSSHCLHKGDLSVACKDAESKHQQGLRPKSQVKSSSVSRQGTAPALVSPMWPTSMVSCVPLEGSGTKNAFRQCRRKKPLRKAEENENEDKSHGGRVKRQHSSGACRPLKRRRTVATVKSRLLKTVIHRTRLHVKTAPRRS